MLFRMRPIYPWEEEIKERQIFWLFLLSLRR